MNEPKASRMISGHTQAEAAAVIGVSRRTWQDWERGIAPILPVLLRLYRHLAGIERIPYRKQRRHAA